ncbi:phage/plasmid replication domain-containing protein [Flagellimonas onchidii]|uniref:phage/plasmid replication domain-containing protein n=1 Tax=Flagellimonas onchidii TaxID=2562684 RepID=UPI0010A616CC|nr:phage/plasmid replication protein [Allomuricauda onchidii]
MIDTVQLRLYGINDPKKGTLNEIAVTNGHFTRYAVPEHNDLYKKMLNYKGKYMTRQMVVSRETHEIGGRDDDDFLTDENSSVVHYHHQTRNVMRFTDERKVKEVNMSINGTYRVPSSYNGITYRINESAGYIDFQMSVPKYLYGHSLAEFVPQINSNLYDGNFLKAHSWGFQQKYIHERLDSFIDTFINDVCNHFQLEALLNKRYIEVRRVDLCFNQYFGSKEDALRYLKHLKAINHNRYKSNQKAPRDYNTSLEYYSSTGAYFKIYHKGTEYSISKDGDLKKHLEVNRKWMDKILKRYLSKESKKRSQLLDEYLDSQRFEGLKKTDVVKSIRSEMLEILKEMADGKFSRENYDGKTLRFASRLYRAMPYKVDFFKKKMDLVLRYELSLKNQWFSYYYKHKVFRKDCDIHNASYLAFKRTKSDKDSRNKGNEPTYKEHKNHKMMNAYLNRKVHLFLETSPILKRFEKKGNVDYNAAKDFYRISSFGLKNTLLHDKDIGTFSNDILKWAVVHFKNICEHYQVHSINPDDDLENRINNYNAEAERRINEYDEKYHYLIYTSNGKQRIKGNVLITKASQLLGQKQKVEMGMKKIRPMVMIAINEQMKRGKSLRMIRKGLKVSDSQWSRYMKDLKKFGISEQARIEPVPIQTCTDWGKMYANLQDVGYYQKFYVSKNHSYYG